MTRYLQFGRYGQSQDNLPFTATSGDQIELETKKDPIHFYVEERYIYSFDNLLDRSRLQVAHKVQ